MKIKEFKGLLGESFEEIRSKEYMDIVAELNVGEFSIVLNAKAHYFKPKEQWPKVLTVGDFIFEVFEDGEINFSPRRNKQDWIFKEEGLSTLYEVVEISKKALGKK